MTVDRRTFWEGRHAANDGYWLTGSNLDGLARLYELSLAPGGFATEIGVGTGGCTRDLARNGYFVSGVDIAQTALDRIEDFADTYLIAELAQAPPADLAICHLVFQHVDAEMVRFILANTRLAVHGTFAFQTAWMDSPAVGLSPDMHGLVWHPPEEVEEAARVAGLEIEWQRRHRFQIKGDVVFWALFRAHRRA